MSTNPNALGMHADAIDAHAHPWHAGGSIRRPDAAAGLQTHPSWQAMAEGLGIDQDASLADAARALRLRAVVADVAWPEGIVIDQAEASALRYGRLTRLDQLWSRALSAAYDPAHLTEAVWNEMGRARSADGFCGWKSVLAYATGLAVAVADPVIVAEQWQQLKSGRPLGELKALSDAALVASAESAAQHGEAIQLHTGLGAPIAGADRVNPSLLAPALASTALGQASLVVLHAGWPYVAEAAWLASEFPNVWVDTSLVGIKYPDELPAVLRRLFAQAPAERILYGSDAHTDFRSHLLHLWLVRRSVAALEEEWRKQLIDTAKIEAVVRGYFSGNAETLYSKYLEPKEAANAER